MADSQELEPQLSAREAMQHRDAVISAGVENIAKANMVTVDADYYQKQHVVARLATDQAINEQEQFHA